MYCTIRSELQHDRWPFFSSQPLLLLRPLPRPTAPAKVLVVAEDFDKNEPDQRQLDALLLSRHGVPTVRGS